MQGEAQLKCLICESSNDASGGALPSLLHLYLSPVPLPFRLRIAATFSYA